MHSCSIVFLRSIMQCVELLKQGRSALATSFANYKFLIFYGECMACWELLMFYFTVIAPQPIWITIDGKREGQQTMNKREIMYIDMLLYRFHCHFYDFCHYSSPSCCQAWSIASFSQTCRSWYLIVYSWCGLYQLLVHCVQVRKGRL